MRRAIGLVLQRCPRCLQGPVYDGFMSMNEHCPVCGVRFGREGGYFTGAMYFSYTLAFIVIIPIWLVLWATDQPLWALLVIPTVVLIVMVPVLWRYSRVVWMYFDRAFDPGTPPPAT